jgi:DNA-binding Xre family transcriptional regulator
MQLSATDKIRIIMMKQNINNPDLGKLLGVTKQSIGVKLNKNNLSEKELSELCKALNCSYEIIFTMNDTKEII